MKHAPEYYPIAVLARICVLILSYAQRPSRIPVAAIALVFAMGILLGQTIPEGFAQRTEEQISTLQRDVNRNGDRISQNMVGIAAAHQSLAEIQGAISAIETMGYILTLLTALNMLVNGMYFRKTQSVGQRGS